MNTRKKWTVQTKNIIAVVDARDQWEAYDNLKDADPLDFGLLVIARSEDARHGEEIAVRTSALFGKRRGKPEIAHLFIARAMADGLPDTSREDCP